MDPSTTLDIAIGAFIDGDYGAAIDALLPITIGVIEEDSSQRLATRVGQRLGILWPIAYGRE